MSQLLGCFTMASQSLNHPILLGRGGRIQFCFSDQRVPTDSFLQFFFFFRFHSAVPDPKFSAAIANYTVPVGREAVLTCLVQDLGSYKVAWLRVDTQTILTIQSHVITKNHRIGISYTEKRIWQLRIKDVKETDRGWYMCQINSDPMKSQVGYLEVVGESQQSNHFC